MSMYNVDLQCFEYGGGKDGIYKDENIIVKPVPIEGNYSTRLQTDKHFGNYLGGGGEARKAGLGY